MGRNKGVTMKRTLTFNQGIIDGYYKFVIIELFPNLEKSFTRRKQYSEFYFEDTEVELTLYLINKLSSEFCIELNRDELRIIL